MAQVYAKGRGRTADMLNRIRHRHCSVRDKGTRVHRLRGDLPLARFICQIGTHDQLPGRGNLQQATPPRLIDNQATAAPAFLPAGPFQRASADPADLHGRTRCRRGADAGFAQFKAHLPALFRDRNNTPQLMIHQHPGRHNRGVDDASFMLAHHIQRAGLIAASPHPAGCQRRFALPQQIGDFRFQQQLVAVDIAASGLLLVLFGQPLPLMREFVLCGFLWRVGPKHRRCNGGIGGAQTHPQRRDPRIGRQVEHEQLAVRRHHVAF